MRFRKIIYDPVDFTSHDLYAFLLINNNCAEIDKWVEGNKKQQNKQ